MNVCHFFRYGNIILCITWLLSIEAILQIWGESDVQHIRHGFIKSVIVASNL